MPRYIVPRCLLITTAERGVLQLMCALFHVLYFVGSLRSETSLASLIFVALTSFLHCTTLAHEHVPPGGA